jgi:hypothetical protein
MPRNNLEQRAIWRLILGYSLKKLSRSVQQGCRAEKSLLAAFDVPVCVV